MESTSSSSSPNRYILEPCGDQYVRWEPPKFRGPRYLFGNDTDPTSESTHKVHSVVENVQMLEKTLQERTVGRDPLSEAWQNAMMAYAEDLERRVMPLIFGLSPIGVFRNSILTMAQRAAKSGLEDFVTSDLLHGPNGQVTFNPSWIFFLLETYLGECIRRHHESLPVDGGDYEEGVAPQLLEEAHFSFDVDKSRAMSAIERIRSSQRLGQAVQFFDMAGGELELERRGLRPREAESVVKTSRVPGDHGSYHDLSVCLPEATRSASSDDVVIVLGQEMWEMASAGLGAGYISWKIEDSDSGHYLLGFSPP